MDEFWSTKKKNYVYYYYFKIYFKIAFCYIKKEKKKKLFL